ncbi:U32 family peptidase [Anaerotignum faecicola]|nr:U32 family peptidase [Anaerotignum faecicola]
MLITKKPELLSPAGSMDSVKAAVNNGCDAVYIGGRQFSARQYADNFGIEELAQVCDYCHLRGVKVYITVNTIYKDGEFKELLNFAAKLYEIGADALIMQDLGAAKLIKENFPQINLHASTQLTSNSLSDVRSLEQAGFSKVVLSRELNLEEIKEITANCKAEIETFIHGALCVCYSGQCIMSSMLGGRSGNRGRCAQTCRLPYTLYNEYTKVKEGHLLSPKDIETVTILPQLIEAGISSFKIEGRMKSPEYVAGVTAVYRKYIDMYFEDPENYSVDEKDIKILLQLFNRGGFSQGYYNNFAGSSMMSPERPKSWGVKLGFIDSYDKKSGRASIRTREPMVPGDGIEIWTEKEPHAGSNINKASKAGEVINIAVKGDINKNDVVYKTHDKALYDELKRSYQKDTRTRGIYGKFKAYIGKPMELTVWDDYGNKVSVTGEEVQRANNQPLSPEKIERQLVKTGGTPFKAVGMEFEGDTDIYIGMGELNAVRRDAVEKLERAVIESSKRKPQGFVKPKSTNSQFIYDKKLNVLVNNIIQFKAAVANENINIIYLEFCRDFEENYKEIIKECHRAGIKLYAAIPRVYRKYSGNLYGNFIDSLKKSGIDGFLVRSMGQFDEFKATGKEIAVDFGLNIFNSPDVRFWREKGSDVICISPELNLNEINEMADEKCEMIGYGHLPLMTTHQCPVGLYAGNKQNGMYCELKNSGKQFYLKDRKGETFPLLTNCKECVCTILNGKPVFLLKFFEEILASPTGALRLMFTTETAAETNRIIEAYGRMLDDWVDLHPSVKKLIREMAEKGSTKGHYFRGIE